MIKSLLVSIMLCLVLIACESPTEPKTTIINEMPQSQPVYCKWVSSNSANYKLLTAPQSLDYVIADTIKVYKLNSNYMVEALVKGTWECQTVNKLSYVER